MTVRESKRAKAQKTPVTVVHCLAPGGNCDWRYDKQGKDWQCRHCGIWEKTAVRKILPGIPLVEQR